MTEDLGAQIDELIAVHRGLKRTAVRSGTSVAGPLPFRASADGLETIADEFKIEILIPHDFPDALPKVRETGGRIGPGYEHCNGGGTLCLGVPVEERRVFLQEPTLLGFVNGLVVPYLYGYCFWKTHGRHPFDEAPHGNEGVVRHYLDVLRLQDELSALRATCFLLEHGYRGHHSCSCGSGRRVRACHGPGLFALHKQHTSATLRSDFLSVLDYCIDKFHNGKLAFPQEVRAQVLRLLDRISRS